MNGLPYALSSRSRLFMALLMAVCAGLPTGSVAKAKAEADSKYHLLWVRTILGPCCADWGNHLVVDKDGALLLAGRRGGLDLNRDGTIDIPTYGSPDSLVMKTYDDQDDARGWVQGPGGPKNDAALGIAADGTGGAFAVGEFEESLHIAEGTLTSAGRFDGFLARYDRDGTAQWAKRIGGSGDDRLQGVGSDGAGNVYVIGTISGAVDIDTVQVTDPETASARAMLIASFDRDGALRWARASRGDARVVAQAIAVGPKGDVYVGGLYMNGRVDLDGDGTPDVPAAAPPDARTAGTPQMDLNGFYARFRPTGEMVWARAVTGPAAQAVGALALADNGDLLVLGGHTGPADTDGDGRADVEFRSMGERVPLDYEDGNTFLIRVNADGKQLWARRYMAFGKTVTAHGERIVIGGYYNGDLDLDDDGVIERAADRDPRLEGFAAVLDGKGALQHVFTIVGGDSDVVFSTAISPDGSKLYVTGYTRLGADFDGDGLTESETVCHQLGDLYLASYAIGR